MQSLSDILEFLTKLVADGGPLISCFLTIFLSILPIIPLGAMISLNTTAYGLLPGICLSYFSTLLGCYISYKIFYHLSDKISNKIFTKRFQKKIDKGIKKFQTLSLPNLTILMTLPFTPAYLMNILAGLTKYNQKKFAFAIIIGKIFMTIFWSCIGKSLIESLTDIKMLIALSIMITIAYIISKIISKNANLD